MKTQRKFPDRGQTPLFGRGNSARHTRLVFEPLEPRCVLAFKVTSAEVFGPTLKLVADFNQPVNAATVQAGDLQVDGSNPATGFNVLDADTIEFLLPALSTGVHAATIAAGAINDSFGAGLDPFLKTIAVAANPQFTVNQNPRLQPGNAPLAAYSGGSLDRADILWQTIPAGVGTQDTFTVQYRAAGATAWQSATANADVATNVENRVVHSASITGLNWNANYEYRVRHWHADVILGQYQSQFRTRLQSGDSTPFTFAAYGDSASGSATGFRAVQARINQNNPAFTVLLGDNVYDAGTHAESDARFSPAVNPEAAAWMASHIDYLGLGNHDVATGSGLPAEQNYSVPIPVAGVTAPAAPPVSERPEHNFSWDYGNVHFVTFDTNSLSDPARLDGLLNWVLTDLNASTARWKIVYGHHPLGGVPDKPESANDNYYQQVVNRLKAAGVDLLMTGHSHTYSWTYPLTGQINGTATFANHGSPDQFVAGVGLPQLVSGLGGKDIRDGDYGQFPFVAAGFTASTATAARLGYSQVNVTPNQLTVSYIAADDGAIIDSFTISKDDTVITTSFEQGTNGYSGTVDTFLQQNSPSTSNATATSLNVDGDVPTGTNLAAQALLRFDNLFGNGVGQIPSNATIRSATLQLQVTNGSVNNMNLHRMLVPWAATDTWNTLTSGVQTNDAEAYSMPDTSSGQSRSGAISFNVLSSVQAWRANPASNKGWAIMPTGTDGVDFNSSEGSVKPKLIVSYVVSAAPNTPPIAVGDTVTTNVNSAVTIPVLANDTDSNGDLLSVLSTTQPSYGTVVVNANGSVTYTPPTGFTGLDSFSYTINDDRGGSSSARVNVAVLQSTSFQQGAAGYTGTIDTFLQQNTPTANNGNATSLNIDGDDPGGTGLDVQALLRFDNLFGTGAGQIPAGATLHSATLQLQVTNAGSSLNLHRMVANWSAADSWDSLSGGIQTNGIEALTAVDVATGSLAIGSVSIDVLPSLLAWASNPAANRGWAFMPSGDDGVNFNSAEGTVKPKLIVSYIPAPPTLQVTTFAPTTTGAITSFSRDLDVSALNLYDGLGANLGAADATLVGATTGAVRGSWLVDANSRQATFVQTGGILLPDSYTFRVRSAADGVHDTSGGLLDGDANGVAGGDFVGTFVVDPPLPAAVTMSIPNFARGPQQAVNVPAAAATGLPISVSNGAGITTVSLQLKYDPALLTVTGVTPASGLPPGTTVNLSTPVNGVATIQFTSPTALPAGSTQLFNLQASVPSTAPYRSKSLLDLSNVVVNGGAIPAVDDDAVQVVAYFGDVTANGSYSAQDASYIARMAVGIDGGLAAYKLLDPTIVGDLSGNGGFSAIDTSKMLQTAVGISNPEIPLPLPIGPLVTGSGPDPKLSIPRDLQAARGETLAIPLNIDSVVDLTGHGLLSADLVLYFDPRVLEVTSVAPGSLVAGWRIASRINSSAGRVDVSLAGLTPIEGKFAGELIRLQARIKKNAHPGVSLINLVATSGSRTTQLNEGNLTLLPAPTNFADATDGLLTVSPGKPSTKEAKTHGEDDKTAAHGHRIADAALLHWIATWDEHPGASRPISKVLSTRRR